MIGFSWTLTVPGPRLRKPHAFPGLCRSLAVFVLVLAGLAACGKRHDTAVHPGQRGPNAALQALPIPTAGEWLLAGQVLPARPDVRFLAQAGLDAPAISVPAWFCGFLPIVPGCADTPRLLPGETQVSNFGSNPGRLRMVKYVPKNLGSARPLVVAMHGCMQSAAHYDDETGWTKLADKFQFALLLPEQDQTGVNNPFRCFRWFDADHNQRGKGEALSIKQMIDTMLADTTLKIDRTRVYVTGLSAGGAMTVVMMATYPEVFAGGGPVAGIPYGCAATGEEATSRCGVSLHRRKGAPATPVAQLSPAEWGDRVRQASSASAFPRISIWHGSIDRVVNPQAQAEMIEQWTNLLGVSTIPQVDETFKNTRRRVFRDGSGRAVVEAFTVTGMDHGTPIDPGAGADQCGTSDHDQYIISAGICSSFYIAKFWGF